MTGQVLRLAMTGFCLACVCVPPTTAQIWAPKAEAVKIGGIERSYYLHVPKGVAGGVRKVPLLLVLHGGAGRAWRMPRFTGFSRLADQHGFVAVYPQGLDRQWNDGRVGKGDQDDVAFLKGLVRHLAYRTGKIDVRRVFVAGISNGGFMAMRLACEATGSFLGVAAVTAQFTTWLQPRCRAAGPISVLFMNGTRDPLVPYDGGVIAPQFGGRGIAASTKDTVAHWVRHNGCASAGKTVRLPNIRRIDFSRVERRLWRRCRSGSLVALYTVINGGHTWPGNFQYLPVSFIGRTNRDIDGSKVIWRFFSRLPPR